MRIIKFICDFCGKTEEVEIPSGGNWPRVMWPIGHSEACDDCRDKALDALKEFKRKLREENEALENNS